MEPQQQSFVKPLTGDEKPPTKNHSPYPVPPTNDNSNPQQGPESSKGVALVANPQNIGQQPFFKIPPTKKDCRKLFIGGLPSDVTDHEFRTFFEHFGGVLDSVVMFDRETHRSRGFGFVTFVDPEVSASLLKMGNYSSAAEGVGRLVMRGKTCEVKPAEPKEAGQRGPGKTMRRDNHKHQQFAYAQPPVFHPDAMAYPTQYPQETVAADPMYPYPYPYPYYDGYMAPMYYPGAPPPPSMMPPTVGEYAAALPPPYPMGPYTMEVLAAPAPVSYPHPYNQQPYACIPLMAMPAPVPLAPAYPQQTPVRQPVAPGTPTKDDEDVADMNNTNNQ